METIARFEIVLNAGMPLREEAFPMQEQYSGGTLNYHFNLPSDGFLAPPEAVLAERLAEADAGIPAPILIP